MAGAESRFDLKPDWTAPAGRFWDRRHFRHDTALCLKVHFVAPASNRQARTFPILNGLLIDPTTRGARDSMRAQRHFGAILTPTAGPRGYS